MEKKKAALFCTNFLEFSQAFVYEELLNHKRYEIDVFSKTRKNENRFPYDSVYSLFPAKGFKNTVDGLLYSTIMYSARFMKILKESQYSLIHAQFGPGSIYALNFAKKLNIPLVVTFGGYDVPLLRTKRRFNPAYLRYWLLSGRMLREVDLFLPVSHDLANKLIELGAPPEKVKVFHRGIVIPEYKGKELKKKNDAIKILMVGRFVEKKGFEYGIEAVSRAVQMNRNMELTIIGTGPLRAVYEKMIASSNMENSIILLDNMPQAEIFKVMEGSDIIMVPSVIARNGDIEGITNVLKEGCARGMAALITHHGGNFEIVEDGKTGFIVPERDADALFEKLMLFSKDIFLIRKMGDAAALKIRNELDIRHTNEILEKHYDDVINNFSIKRMKR